ncbi:MAG: scyllo-inositol 2-dehydrogenase (NAD(+)) [Verrucomicrobia subdivision 3 bacterium]|nr:scyllo-inositol 2-dehydrogenase (NAD(+)) [Limisphaerales bacterium]MCS1414331.1 scyllo-inositol 2-dehydrogenase (NAD(+)) [Limisphaerales bacterium]
MAEPIKIAVVGAGALGSQHVRLYAEMAAAGTIQFSGIYDQNHAAAESLAKQYSVTAAQTLEELTTISDALSVVTPTVTHYDITKRLLEQGKHALVEKPMTETLAQATELVALSRQQRKVLQIGHIERFNPVFQYLQKAVTQPRFIEAHRLSPFPARSTDIGVVLDIMIHDLDVVLAFVQSPVASVEGVGVSVLSSSEDIANARLRFENGCIANLTASRISPNRLRKIRVFSAGDPASYVSLDYPEQEGFIYRIARDGEEESSLLRKLWASKKKDLSVVSEFAGRRIVREPVPIKKDQPLKLELESFVECVQASQTPVVSGESAKKALDLAIEITAQINDTK